MKVSVVITVFKRPERLQKAIDTVKNQTFKDIEIIVVDGSNSLEMKSICEKEHVKYLQVEPEYTDVSFWKGIQHQRNVGCNAAIGKYIAMLDDDDEWEPTKLEKQLKVFDSVLFDDIGAVVCYSKIMDNKTVYIDKPKNQPQFDELLRMFNYSSTSAYLIKKDIFLLTGGWNESLRGMHEYDLALKISKNGFLIMCVPEVLMYRYRSFNFERQYYFIKIGEIFDLWHNYGNDMTDRLSLSELFINAMKTLGLFLMFILGFKFKEKIWKFIYIVRTWVGQGNLI